MGCMSRIEPALAPALPPSRPRARPRGRPLRAGHRGRLERRLVPSPADQGGPVCARKSPRVTNPQWSMRSVLVSVRNLDRSIAFYAAVLGLSEVGREGQAAVLDGDGRPFALLLREVSGQGVVHGQQALGLRAVVFDVGSRSELDNVAKRLEAAGARATRSRLHETEPFEILTARDPDGLPLTFVTYEGGPLQADHFRHVALHTYGLDL